MNFLRNVYFSIFILFFKIGEGQWPSAFEADLYKGVAGLSTIISALFVAILINSGLPGRHSSSDKWLVAAGCLVIYLINAYYLIFSGRGLKFEAEFKAFTKIKRIALYLQAVGVVIVVGAFAYMSAIAHRRALGNG